MAKRADKFCSLCQKSACLYQALQKKDVYFAFQPVIDIKEKKVLFHEVLLSIFLVYLIIKKHPDNHQDFLSNARLVR